MNLTNANYFSLENQMKYMGVSQYKAFKKCQASALAEVTGEYVRKPTTALLVGSYVDSYFEGELDNFKLLHPELFKRDGTLKSEFAKANEIITRIESDKLFMDYLSGEKQVIMTGTIEGVAIKIKVDVLHDDKIVDLKIMADFADKYIEEQGRVSWVEAWGYDIQGAVYQEIVRQNIGRKLPFYLSAATKENEPDIDIVQIPQEFLDYELEEFCENVPLYDAIKKGLIEPERCEHCDFCKRTKVLKQPRMLGVLDYE